MRARSFQRLVLSLLLSSLSHIAAAERVSISNALATAKTRCGYDLTELKPRLTAASVESFSTSGIKVIFHWRSKSPTQFTSAQLSISCADPLNNTTSQGGQVPDAQAVIQEEDAGGRYFRHVASQKLIKGRNWRANVAVIDYMLGDAQQIRKNEILACNADVLAPCISMSVNEPRRLSKKYLSLLYSIVEQIAVIRKGDGSVDEGRNAASTASAPRSQ